MPARLLTRFVEWPLDPSTRDLVRADVKRWFELGLSENWGWMTALATAPHELRLGALLRHSPEFRGLFYYRLGRTSRRGARFAAALRRLLPEPPALYIATPSVGPGLYLAHGYATFLAAREIGTNCRIHQNVTLGWNEQHGVPTIGDRVTIFTGAVVIGEISVGDDATIGANAVVTRDVAPGTTVGGVPAKEIRPRIGT